MTHGLRETAWRDAASVGSTVDGASGLGEEHPGTRCSAATDCRHAARDARGPYILQLLIHLRAGSHHRGLGLHVLGVLGDVATFVAFHFDC